MITETSREAEDVGTVVVGGGPAALALLLAALREPESGGLFEAGLRIFEQTAQLGSGDIGRYAIRSDSHADSFINALRDSQIELTTEATSGLLAKRGSPAELQEVGKFLGDLVSEVRRRITADYYDPFLVNTRVRCIVEEEDHAWRIYIRDAAGEESSFRARCVVIATGGYQSADQLADKVIGEIPLAAHRDKIMLSGDFLSQRYMHSIASGGAGVKSIAILGGSHSAMACARCIIESDAPSLRTASVHLFHRNDLRLTYGSAREATSDGYLEFGESDICPRTARVYPLAGFRGDSRDLLRGQRSLGGLKPNPRLALQDLRITPKCVVESSLDKADLIVAALGYQSRGVEIRNVDRTIRDLASTAPGKPLVNASSEALDIKGHPIKGVYAMGMSAGYPLAGIYGEPSFKGVANGWALWRTDVGQALVRSLLTQLRV